MMRFSGLPPENASLTPGSDTAFTVRPEERVSTGAFMSRGRRSPGAVDGTMGYIKALRSQTSMYSAL